MPDYMRSVREGGWAAQKWQLQKVLNGMLWLLTFFNGKRMVKWLETKLKLP